MAVFQFLEEKSKRETNKKYEETIKRILTAPNFLDSFDQKNLPKFLSEFLEDLKEKVPQYAIVYINPVGELRYSWRSTGTKELSELLLNLEGIVQKTQK